MSNFYIISIDPGYKHFGICIYNVKKKIEKWKTLDLSLSLNTNNKDNKNNKKINHVDYSILLKKIR